MNARLLSPWVTRFLLVIMLCLPVWGNQVSAQTPESYAVLDEATGTLTFRHDAKKPAGAYPLNSPEELPGWFVEGENFVNKNRIEKVVFDASFAAARPTSCRYWFVGCTELKTIEGIEYLNTENVTDMYAMFYGCNNLTALDVSDFDTKNVTNMTGMFYECNNLTTLNVSNFDTKNVTDMGWMFYHCNNLTTLNVANFDTKNVTNMQDMFRDCKSLTALDVSNFDTKNVTDMQAMFYGCYNLTTLDLSKFNTQKVADMKFMFFGCTNLTTLNVSNFDTKNVTNMKSMFYGCINLTTLELSNFDTKNVTNMGWMFLGCNSLITLNVSNFDTQKVADMSFMFCGCSNLTTIYVSDKFVTTACEDGDDMFKDCEKLVGAVPYDGNKTGKEMANYTTGYFTDIKTTGIDATPVSDNIAAKYYDVQGRRMDAPQKGINIVKRGGRTMKVLMK